MTKFSDKYRAFDFWKRTEAGELVRYRCFEDIKTSRFCVQNVDFYRDPVVCSHVLELEKQFIELLLEEDPFERSGSFASIDEAIADHDASFQ